MALQLFAQYFPQWKIGTATRGARNFLVPWPDQEDISESVARDIDAYEASTWRGEHMSLLEFLRKSDDAGEGKIVQWNETFGTEAPAGN